MPSTSNWFVDAQKHHQAQRFDQAETLYRRIVENDPKHVGAWYHLGLTCIAQGRSEAAAENFKHVLDLSPDHVDALTQLGIVLARDKHLQDAITKFRRAIELRPQHAKAHNNLGVALMQLGQPEEGLTCYREAARLQPDYAEAHFNLAVALADRKQNEEALASYESALQARPDYPDALYNLGLLLVDERRTGEAVILLEQAVRLKPDNPEAHNNLSLALADLGRFEDAIASSDAALRLRPLDAKSHMNRGNALSALGRIDEAVACYGIALRLQPDYVNAHWNRALAWLAQGDFARGWPEYEWRWKRAETKTRHFPEPIWDGRSLEGKTILLWCEQGFGDTLHFVRYAALVKRHGACVWLECPARLVPLLSTCLGVDRVLPEGAPLPPGFDCHAPLMSLPHLCGTTPSSVPGETPYLSAASQQVEHWRQELSVSPHFKIGIAWQGNPKHRGDRHRSVSVHWFRSLAMLEGVELYSLQKGNGFEQLSTVRFPITDLGSQLDETGSAFQETAAVMQALDLVITCDSALAHLAGALGVPVWVPLAIPTDWRWVQNRDDTPWYPTMRLFRQSQMGQWRPVFERIQNELQALRDQTRRTNSNEPAHELAPYFNLLSTFNNQNLVALDLAHNVFLVGAALARKPGRILELGVGSAYVTKSLLHALRFNRKGTLTSVDNWFDWGGQEPAFVAPLRKEGVNIVASAEEEFVRSAADDSYDFLVSDADHFKSGNWLDQHLRIVEHDGFLFFHDTNQPEIFQSLATIETQVKERGLPYHHFKEGTRPDERCHRGWLFVINKKR